MARCQAILFDMDGTLVDSTYCVEEIWGRWAQRNGLELSAILAASHGRRTVDTLREIAPHLDVEREAQRLDAEELQTKDGIEGVPGAAALLCLLPPDRWAVVTSASRALAELRLRCADLPIPCTLVSGDDVAEGKPSPAGYQLAAALLRVPPEECLVVEDTPAGILAGRRAGMQVLAVTTTYTPDCLLGSPWIKDFREARITVTPSGIELRTRQGRISR